MRLKRYIIYLLILCPLGLAAQVRMVASFSGTVILEFSLDTCWIDSTGLFHSDPTLPSDSDGRPYFTDILYGVPPEAEIGYYVLQEKHGKVRSSRFQNQDRAKGSEIPVMVTAKASGSSPSFVALRPGPMIRGNRSAHLTIYPALAADENVIITKATIQINWDAAPGPAPQLLSGTRFSRLVKNETKRFRSGDRPPEYQFSPNLLEIRVDSLAWYHITYSELADSIADINAINPVTFQIWQGDREQPIYVRDNQDGSFDPGDEIIFRGRPPEPPPDTDYQANFYTGHNVYWLTWGGAPGKRYITESGYPGQPAELTYRPDYYRQTRHIERNDYFSRLGTMRQHEQWDRFDHFFMQPPIYAGNLKSFNFHLPSPVISETATAVIRLTLQGITSSTHAVKYLINDHLLGSGTWDNQASIVSEISFSQEYLLAGDNTLTILNEEFPDGSNRHDMVLLNWIEVEYDRYYDADNSNISFSCNGIQNVTAQFELSGFSSPDILLFKENLSLIDDFLVVASDGSYTVIFQDNIGGSSPAYHALTRSDLLTVSSLRRKSSLRTFSEINPADYIIIAPDSFKTVLQPLTTAHSGTFVDIDWIYRTYSGGVLSPYAIRSFLQEAWRNWSSPVNYVLLAMQGKWMGWSGTPDSRENFIPAMRMQTVGFGAVSSDYWYSLVSGDDLIPEFAIGRFPVRNKMELTSMVSKTLSCLNRPPGDWSNQVLNIGGYESVFKDQSEQMIAREVNRGCYPIRLYIDQYSEGGPFYGTTDSLIHYFNRGLSYVNFLGHGGGAVWGDRSLMQLEDVAMISNAGKLPFVTSMTCFTGDVTNPNALSRRMLEKEKGAVAWFGSSGVGWIINDFLLLWPIHSQLFDSLSIPLGDIINQGKIQYLATNTGYPDITISQLYQFNLSGDPALTLHLPQPLHCGLNPVDPEPGETISLSTPIVPDSVSLLIYDNSFFSSSKYPTTVSESFTFPENTAPGRYTIVLRGKENNLWRAVARPVQVSGTMMQWLTVAPEYPDWTDSIHVRIKAQDRQGIDSLWLYVNEIKKGAFQPVGNDEYVLENPLHDLPPLSVNQLMVVCRDGAGNMSESDTRNLRIRGPLQVSLTGLSIVADDSIYVRVKGRNLNTEQGEATLSLYHFQENTWSQLTACPVMFTGTLEVATDFAVIPKPGELKFRAILTPVKRLATTHIDTLDATLYSNYFWSLPETGTTTDFISHTALSLHQSELEINPNTHSEPVILYYSEDRTEKETFQTGLTFASTITTVRRLPGIPYELTLIPDTVLQDSARLFRWYGEYDEWLPCDRYSSSDAMPIQFEGDGRFAYFTITDQRKPRIEAAVNGQRFMPGVYLSTKPLIQFLASDENGIDPREGHVFIWVDGEQVSENIISNLSVERGILSLECRPELDEDNRTLGIMVEDACGNLSDTLMLEFTVFSKLDLIDYGNFPNPFIDQTIFAYELTESVEKLYLDIYSLDGRHVRRFDEESSLTSLDPRVGAFHEIIWDGRDKNGDFVGNGVYFYRLVATKGKQKLVRTGKVAKAR